MLGELRGSRLIRFGLANQTPSYSIWSCICWIDDRLQGLGNGVLRNLKLHIDGINWAAIIPGAVVGLLMTSQSINPFIHLRFWHLTTMGFDIGRLTIGVHRSYPCTNFAQQHII
jgi:hypothetical protein